MKENKFVAIEVHGDGYDRGYEHGSRLKDYIQPYFEKTLANLKTIPNRDSLLKESQAYMQKTYPALLEEMRGIAEGAEMPYEDIFLLNHIKLIARIRAGCSNLGLADSGLGPVLIGTVDGNTPVTGPMFIQKLYPKQGHSILASVIPGTIWVEKAVNELGVALGNSSVVADDFRIDGLPLHALFRETLLHSSSAAEAAKFLLTHHQNASSCVIIVVDAGGGLARIEKTPTKTIVSRTNQKYASAANAFLETETKALAVKTPEKDYERRGRYAALDQYGAKLFPAGTLEEMRECLRHHGVPASICRHGNADLSLTRESYIIQAGENVQGMYVGERGFACQTKIDAYFQL